MEDRPTHLPQQQINGEPPLPLAEVLLRRRATPQFNPEIPVPKEMLAAIMNLALQAPSGYNLQPWRFIIVQGATNREKLMKAAFNQKKIGEAPVTVIALGMKEAWKETMDEVLREGAQRGLGDPANIEKIKAGALNFLSHMSMPVWVNRHVMIAVTTMMLVAESYGFDTAPMEGFDAQAIKREFSVPDEAEVVCLLAIGKAAGPERAYPGRFGIEDIVYSEKFGQPLLTRQI